MIQSETPHGPKRLGGPYGGHYLSPLVQIGLGNVHKGYPIFWQFLEIPKGQLISEANCQAVDSPKKRTNEFAFFDLKCCYVVKSNTVFFFENLIFH